MFNRGTGHRKAYAVPFSPNEVLKVVEITEGESRGWAGDGSSCFLRARFGFRKTTGFWRRRKVTLPDKANVLNASERLASKRSSREISVCEFYHNSHFY